MDRIEREFLRFHSENPTVYEELKELSFKLLSAGRDFYGIGALFEVVRFHRAIMTTDPHFKLNNNHRALYSRMLMKNEPLLEGFFRTRIRKAELMDENHDD